MKNIGSSFLFAALGIALFYFFSPAGEALMEDTFGPPPEAVAPNWASIAAWPARDNGAVEAVPDPNRRITAIVLDDSGSMGADIDPAKAAVLQAVASMEQDDRVAVVALNAGTVLAFTRVGDATGPLQNALRRVDSSGSTPLTEAVQNARVMLEEEAAAARSFGTYRMIVTTDGQADNDRTLTRSIEEIAAATPIQLATIGIGIRGGHVLRRDDLGSFVDVSNVDALQSALEDAIAENADFTAITEFAGDG
ncbi:MAG: VWA domain-containing protein [Pseudomonadota bacterium]